MRLVIVTRDDEDYSRSVTEWVREFEHRSNQEVEMLDPDTREGQDLCRAYDVVEYPTILALNESDGAVLSMWRGRSLPMFDEVIFWVGQ